MRRRKGKFKFKTIVIKKRALNGATAVILTVFITALLLSSAINGFSKSILSSAIPMIFSTEELTSSIKNKFTESINSSYVLANSMPILKEKKLLKKEPKENEAAETAVSESTVPVGAYPITETKSVGKSLQIRNETTYQPDLNALLNAPLSFSSPEILIVHTHASEAYTEEGQSYYTENETNRNIDTEKNMVRVGSELAKELTNLGFKVTHAREINDYPSYNKSYSKTLDVINYYLKNNPNIQIVLDIHRDSVIKADGTKMKFVTDINGEKVAQVMIVSGTNQAGLENDTWQENLKFALKLQSYMENEYPELARPLNLRQERFNTHATFGSLIIEIGTGGNTLSEALASTKYLAKTIKETLKLYR